jgi:hypothetical protein
MNPSNSNGVLNDIVNDNDVVIGVFVTGVKVTKVKNRGLWMYDGWNA